MPNKWTFMIKPIKELLDKEVIGDFLDPFAGFHSIVDKELQNDINRETPAKYHEDALDWLKIFKNNLVDGVLYDPPYSITQARQYGKKEYASMKYWADCKNEIARIIKPGGKAICFG